MLDTTMRVQAGRLLLYVPHAHEVDANEVYDHPWDNQGKPWLRVVGELH